MADAETIELPDADVRLLARAVDARTADRWFDVLRRDVGWRQESVRLFGRSIPQPRLIAWHGDAGAAYTYSGLRLDPAPWNATLAEARDLVQRRAGWRPNSVLLNLYRDGADSMGWHADDEPELGPEPRIASLSLGATRRFVLRHRARRDLEPVSLELSHGSLLLMAGATQAHWKHAVPKTRRAVGERINLTFRETAGA